MDLIPQVNVNSGKTLWHITIDLSYEGVSGDAGEDGVQRVLSALSPIVEEGRGVKRLLIKRLAEKG